MAETPADYADTMDATAVESRVSQDGGRSLPARRWVLAGGAAIAVVTMLLDTAGVHAFGVAGALTVLGLAAIAAAALYSFSTSNAQTLSRSPLAAVEALNVLPDPCYATDRRGAMLFANEAYRMLAGGLDLDRPVPLERLLAGRGDMAEVAFRLAQAARTGFAADEDVRIEAPGGLARVYKVVVRPLSGADGGAVWLFRDLTAERERAESAESVHKRSLSYLETAPVGFFAADIRNGRLVYLNPKLGKWLGLEPARVTERGLTLADLVLGEAPALTDGDGEANGEMPPLDLDLKGPEGRAVPVRIMRSRLEGVGGRSRLLFGLVLNRTTGDKAEVTVRDAEMRFARFFNNAPIGITTVGQDGRIENANSAFVGYVGEGVERGTRLTDLVAEDDRPAVDELLSRSRAGRSSGAVDIRLVRNAERVGQLYAARVDAGEGAALVVYLIDATEQKSLEMQFAQSQKMQAVGQLAGGVAHDFNNLLTAIIGFCDLLLARHQAGDPSFADVVQIKQNANRAANLTRQLLAFSRRQTLRPKVLSLTDALAELQNLLARLLTEKVELKIVHGRDLGLVKVDQNQLEQVVINLAVNARDAMPDEGGRLTIRTANVSEADSRALDHALMPHGEYVLIEVADTGHGIPKENLGKIFEPFYTTKDPSKGTGLGLSTVYGIVKQTGGFIFPYSTVGKGTTFRIYLPRYIETAAERRQEEISLAAAPPEPSDLTGKGTILLVEDEDAVRTFAARALATRGYEVLQAESGEAALAVVDAHEGRIDLVVSDVVMPNMDGPTMAKELKHKLPNTPIIFVSGYAEDAFAKSLDPEQEFHFLPKPFSLKQLAAAVKEVMKAT